MEVQARYALMGAFTAAVILAIFAFIYWLENSGGLRERSFYQIHFEGSVSGLLVGSGVSFNGIRVGEVTDVSLSLDRPKDVLVKIAVEPSTPVRSDTKVGIDFQGLTGAPVVMLSGGSPEAAKLVSSDGKVPLLMADPAGSMNWTESARQALNKINTILSENAVPFRELIANLETFSGALSKNSDRIDGILAGIARMTGGSKPSTKPSIYDIVVPKDLVSLQGQPNWQLSIPEPTTLLAFNTDKILIEPRHGETIPMDDARWSDNLPNLFQEKIIQSFENAGYIQQATRRRDGLENDYQLLIDIRGFKLSTSGTPTAVSEFVGKIVDKNGKIIAARDFKTTAPAQSTDASGAAEALNNAFFGSVKLLVQWTAEVI